MGCRPMVLLDAGEAKELVPLKMLFMVHNYCYSLVAYLPVSCAAVDLLGMFCSDIHHLCVDVDFLRGLELLEE